MVIEVIKEIINKLSDDSVGAHLFEFIAKIKFG